MNKTMHAAICDRPGHIEIKTVPIPPVDHNKVLIKVEMCGVCSSDLVPFHGGGYKKYPYSPGHEFYGIIVTLGKGVSAFRLGQRVVVNPNLGCGKCKYCISGKSNLCDYLKTRNIKSNGGFAEYVALDVRMIYSLPDSFPLEYSTFYRTIFLRASRCGHCKCRSRRKDWDFWSGMHGAFDGNYTEIFGL